MTGPSIPDGRQRDYWEELISSALALPIILMGRSIAPNAGISIRQQIFRTDGESAKIRHDVSADRLDGNLVASVFRRFYRNIVRLSCSSTALCFNNVAANNKSTLSSRIIYATRRGEISCPGKWNSPYFRPRENKKSAELPCRSQRFLSAGRMKIASVRAKIPPPTGRVHTGPRARGISLLSGSNRKYI